MEYAAHELKAELFAEVGRIGAALGNGHRLRILDLLSQRSERTVEDLAGELGVTIGSTSQHLLVLHRARLVDVRRQGTYAFYRIAGDDVSALWRQLRDVANRRAPEVEAIVRRYRPAIDDRGDIDLETLLARLERNEVVLLDARPIEEYRSGHLPGAYFIDPSSLDDSAALPSMDLEKDLIVYCRGPYCVFADEAVTMLRSRGFTAHRLTLGVPEWRALGFAVAVGDPPA